MTPFQPPYIGAAYYPEDWPLEQIDEDIALMKQAGCNVMRIAEFAWSRMEPSEGQYDFEWLHLVVDKLSAAGIATIMCTPTCTPPQWLSAAHPEILYVRPDEGPMKHGGRRHACPNSPVYRKYCEIIVTKMAEEFGRDGRVIGWQVDNEVYSPAKQGRSCVCPACMRKFQDTMRDKFGTIENLNDAWGTGLWSQDYLSFDSLPGPDTNIWHHPSLFAAWDEFTSDSFADFVRAQSDIIHDLTNHPVGTDMMPMSGIDYGEMHKALDIVQFNHYNEMHNLWEVGFWFDMIRPLKNKPFWNTETSTCWNGSGVTNGYKDPGFCVANSWLPIAFGGEANLYWLWRQHWAGQELMHGSVISSHGRPLHIMEEVQAVSRGFSDAESFINGTEPTITGLGLHLSHKAQWMFLHQLMVPDFDYIPAVLHHVYRPLVVGQMRPDILLPSVDLSPYKLIFSPFLMTLDESGLRQRLREWIENGGTWIAGPMTDIRTEHATKFKHSPFGSIEEWGGVYRKYEIPGNPRDFHIQWSDGRESTGSMWYDGFELRGAEALASYSDGPLQGLAAVTRHKMGKGQVIVLGTLPAVNDLPGVLISLCDQVGVSPVAQASQNLYVIPREGPDGEGMIVVEVENKPATLTLTSKMTDLLTRSVHEGTISVKPYSVMVLKY